MSNPEQPGGVPPYAPQYPVQPGQQYPGQQYPGQQYPVQPSAAPYPYPYASAPQPGTNVLAIVSLVSAFFVSIVAIVTGHIALSQIKRTGEGGRGLALAGLIIGYVSVAVTVFLVIIWFVIFFVAITTHSMATSGLSS